MINGFLLGIIAVNCVMIGIFFLRFWRETHDILFFCFAIAFLIESANRAAVLGLKAPNEGSPVIYIVRLISALVILFGILRKNYGTSGRS